MKGATTKPTMPPDEQIEIAILWLLANEGEGDEAAACKAVARWLETAVADRQIKIEARKAGVPVAWVRRRLAGL